MNRFGPADKSRRPQERERHRNIIPPNRVSDPRVGGVQSSGFTVGHNPRYSRWTRENWMGHSPDIGTMFRRGWSLTFRCPRCRNDYKADVDKIIRLKGRSWSPWGRSAPCPKVYCGGRMTLRAYAPGPNEFIDI